MRLNRGSLSCLAVAVIAGLGGSSAVSEAATPSRLAESGPPRKFAKAPTRAARSAGQLHLALPAPTGPAPVGESHLDLVDRSRTDPWVPESGPRRLTVSMFYPAIGRGGRPAPYMTVAESNAFLGLQREWGTEFPPGVSDDALAGVATGARTGLPPRPALGGHPLVLLSPGFSWPRATLTGLATELASRGYVVALVDHTYETAGVLLGNGTLAPCAACDAEAAAQTWEEFVSVAARVPRGRAVDMSFVLDRLLGPRPAWRDAWMIDRRRVAMVGHSIGGNSAATAMEADRRIDAGVNLDGSFFEPIARNLDRPFLLMGTDDLHRPDGADDTWPRDWGKLTGYRRWLTVALADHGSFTDFSLLDGQLGFDLTGYLPEGRGMEITRAYVGAFLDRTLRGRDPALLRGPSSAFGDVTFHDPH